MSHFYIGCAKTLLVVMLLFISFIITTALFDTFERHLGYYAEGIKDSNELSLGQ